MGDPYLYYKSIKDNPVCGHLGFNCLKLKSVNHDLLLFIFAPGFTVSTWRCVVLTFYDRHRCQTIARYIRTSTGFTVYYKIKVVHSHYDDSQTNSIIHRFSVRLFQILIHSLVVVRQKAPLNLVVTSLVVNKLR